MLASVIPIVSANVYNIVSENDYTPSPLPSSFLIGAFFRNDGLQLYLTTDENPDRIRLYSFDSAWGPSTLSNTGLIYQLKVKHRDVQAYI